MSKLKPCPFCGGESIMRHRPTALNVFSYVACTRCGATGKEIQISSEYASDDKAAEAWNRRANDDPEN